MKRLGLDNDETRLLSRDRMTTIMEAVRSFSDGQGITACRLTAWWRGEVRWARNRISLASERRDYRLSLTRIINGGRGEISINQLDDQALQTAIRYAERDARLVSQRHQPPSMDVPVPELPHPSTLVWSDSTFNLGIEQRSAVGRSLTKASEERSMFSSGYLECRGSEVMSWAWGQDVTDVNPDDIPMVTTPEYSRHTQAQCSMTVRHPKGSGSGWAGVSAFNWSSIDSQLLADVALQKCLNSVNPVAIEPGRFTVILEPQAVAALVGAFMGAFARSEVENGGSIFTLGRDEALKIWRSRLGMKVVDERITIAHDPMDPALGVLPSPGLSPLTFVEKGVLVNLEYNRTYALSALNYNLPLSARPGYKMSGGNTTVNEMISSTTRGILVTRFSGIDILDTSSILMTGITRDGLWLVENGAVTKSIKNMRFTDSPVFVLNQIEQIGAPVPVFEPLPFGLNPVFVPPIKSNDFSFSSTFDSI